MYGETSAELAKAPPVPSEKLEPVLQHFSEDTNNIVAVPQDSKDSQNIPNGDRQVSEAPGSTSRSSSPNTR
jgi:hypothetical protein